LDNKVIVPVSSVGQFISNNSVSFCQSFILMSVSCPYSYE